MAWRFVKQPNGLLGRFSDIVDNFTHLDLTEADAFDVALDHMGREDAAKKVQAGVDDIKPWSTEKGDGLSRWRDSLETIEMVHGLGEVKKIESELTPSP